MVDPDTVNPRFLGNILARNGGKPLTKQQICEAFENAPQSLKLKNSIEQNGGLLNPILAERTGNRYRSRDGNDRWYVYQQLHAEDPKKWSHISLLVFPEDMPEAAKREALRILHNIGSSEWPAESRTAFALLGRQDGKTDEEIARSAGFVQMKDFKLHEQVYDLTQQYMTETKDRESHWSQWFEVVKKSPAKVANLLDNKVIRKKAFKAMKDGKLINPQKARGLVVVMQNETALNALDTNKDKDSALEIALDIAQAGKDTTDVCFKKMEAAADSLLDKKDKLIERLQEGQSDDFTTFSRLFRSMYQILYRSGVGQTVLFKAINLEELQKRKAAFEAKKKKKKDE